MRSSKDGNFVLCDKAAIQYLRNIKGRSFSKLEAYFSFAKDVNCEKKWTISGYAAMWGWSRCKVRKFTSELLSEKGQASDRQATPYGHAIHLIQGENSDRKDRQATGKRQASDTTIKTKTKTKKKKKEIYKEKFGIFRNVFLSNDEKSKLDIKFNGTSQQKIDTLSEYVESSGKKYRSHYATILSWDRRDKKQISKPKRRHTTIDAFNGMMENLNGTDKNGTFAADNSIETIGPLGLPLPE